MKSNIGKYEESYCDLLYCDALPTANKEQKCEGVTKSSYIVPSNAKSITIQMKDGIFDGKYDCYEDGHHCRGTPGKNLCSPNGVSQVCQVELELSDCYPGTEPDPVSCNDYTCPDLPCASRSCHGYVCKIDEYKDDEHVCRKKADPCDKTEYCEGHHTAMCPEDIRRDSTPGYALACENSIYLCGITEDALTESKKGHHSWYLADKEKCNLGKRGDVHKLRFPDCTLSCPSIWCPNDHEVDKYIVAKCDATESYDNNPWRCDSSHEVTYEEYKQKTICPLNPTGPA